MIGSRDTDADRIRKTREKLQDIEQRVAAIDQEVAAVDGRRSTVAAELNRRQAEVQSLEADLHAQRDDLRAAERLLRDVETTKVGGGTSAGLASRIRATEDEMMTIGCKIAELKRQSGMTAQRRSQLEEQIADVKRRRHDLDQFDVLLACLDAMIADMEAIEDAGDRDDADLILCVDERSERFHDETVDRLVQSERNARDLIRRISALLAIQDDDAEPRGAAPPLAGSEPDRLDAFDLIGKITGELGKLDRLLRALTSPKTAEERRV